MRLKLYRGVWCAVWTEHGGSRRVSLRTKDREAAERALIDLRRDMAAPPAALVGQIVDGYIEERRAKVADARRMEDAWRAAKATLGHLRPDQITGAVCRQYAASRRAMGRKDGTIIKELNVVRAALNWRKAAGHTFELPQAPPPRDRHLTRDEFRRLLDAAAPEPHIRLFCVLGLATAGRAAAILGLTWDRVDFDRGLIRLGVVGERRMKGRATVPMTAMAREALTEAKRGARSPYVIEYAERGVGSVKKGFAAACRRAGIEGVSPHILRHTAAVWMAEAGVSMDEIASYLGHSDPRLTYRVYAKFSPTYLAKAASALDL